MRTTPRKRVAAFVTSLTSSVILASLIIRAANERKAHPVPATEGPAAGA